MRQPFVLVLAVVLLLVYIAPRDQSVTRALAMSPSTSPSSSPTSLSTTPPHAQRIFFAGKRQAERWQRDCAGLEPQLQMYAEMHIAARRRLQLGDCSGPRILVAPATGHIVSKDTVVLDKPTYLLWSNLHSRPEFLAFVHQQIEPNLVNRSLLAASQDGT